MHADKHSKHVKPGWYRSAILLTGNLTMCISHPVCVTHSKIAGCFGKISKGGFNSLGCRILPDLPNVVQARIMHNVYWIDWNSKTLLHWFVSPNVRPFLLYDCPNVLDKHLRSLRRAYQVNGRLHTMHSFDGRSPFATALFLLPPFFSRIKKLPPSEIGTWATWPRFSAVHSAVPDLKFDLGLGRTILKYRRRCQLRACWWIWLPSMRLTQP